MVAVNNSNKLLTTPMTRKTLKPMNWFQSSDNGRLYLAWAWNEDPSKTIKVWLDAVCFDPRYGTMHAIFSEDEHTKVNVVYDTNVSINFFPVQIP